MYFLFLAQNTAGSSLDFTPTADFPALQYLDRVDKNSPADRAGLKPGDFLLEVGDSILPCYIFIFCMKILFLTQGI